jgi:hypothetical protein
MGVVGVAEVAGVWVRPGGYRGWGWAWHVFGGVVESSA